MQFNGSPVIGIAPAFNELRRGHAIDKSRQGCAVQAGAFSQFTGRNLIFVIQKSQNQGLDRCNIERGNLLCQKTVSELIGFGQLKKNTIIRFQNSPPYIACLQFTCVQA
jgi:hypothetical protein